MGIFRTDDKKYEKLGDLNLSYEKGSIKAIQIKLGLLKGDQVLITGYSVSPPDKEYFFSKVFDVKTKRVIDTHKMNAPRRGYVLTSLPDGQVLVSGGGGPLRTNIVGTLEIFNPKTNSYKLLSSSIHPRQAHYAFTSGNEVIFIGGVSQKNSENTIDFYVLGNGGKIGEDQLPKSLKINSATPLKDNTFLLMSAGWGEPPGLYDISTREYKGLKEKMPCNSKITDVGARLGHKVVSVNDEQVFIIGGQAPAGSSPVPCDLAILLNPWADRYKIVGYSPYLLGAAAYLVNNHLFVLDAPHQKVLVEDIRRISK